MSELSRRDFLLLLAIAYGDSLMGGCTRKGDWFAKERVCIHVLHPAEFIPAPLLEKTARVHRTSKQNYFYIGLPELSVCQSQMELLRAFDYFWPFSRGDFERLQNAVNILYQKPSIDADSDITEFAAFLREHKTEFERTANSAVIFVLNEFTHQWGPDVVSTSREAGIKEFVVLKDPSKPPYLCDYPAKQKGFKRTPP